jgi:hypothetical protein
MHHWYGHKSNSKMCLFGITAFAISSAYFYQITNLFFMKFNIGSFSKICKFWLHLAYSKAHFRSLLHVVWPSTVP